MVGAHLQPGKAYSFQHHVEMQREPPLQRFVANIHVTLSKLQRLCKQGGKGGEGAHARAVG